MHPRLVRSILIAVAVLALLAPVATTANAQEAPPDRSDAAGTPLQPTARVEGDRAPTSRLAASDEGLVDRTDGARVPVLIKFDYDSIATYAGGSHGAEATSPSVTGEPLTPAIAEDSEYAQQVIALEDDIVGDLEAAVPSVTIGRRLRVVFGGVAATVPANQVAALLDVDGVVAVQSDELLQPQTDSSTDFIDAPPVWDDLGGQALAGQGVLFASLDSGVWPEHPSFADNPDLGPAPTANDGSDLTCEYGDNPLTPATDVFACNDKLVGGEPFLDTYNSLNEGEVFPDSARDSDGHGTHTASTAAGDIVESAMIFGVDRGRISGVAPGAWVKSYKVCGVEGCYSSDSAAAVETAIFDGADVINFSISGGSDPFSDPVELAFLDAYAANVFVAASAGNSGPDPSTSDHLSPWVTTVGASTQTREFSSTLTLTADDASTVDLDGASITAGVDEDLPVVLAEDVPGYEDAGCTTEPASNDVFEGMIVACHRVADGVGRVERGHNLLLGGAAGMVLYNPTLADVETDNHWLPAVHLADGTDFLAFMAGHTGVTGSFTGGVARDGQGDVMASFSSRGPAGRYIKPDLTAPGVQILAGHTPVSDEVVLGPPGEYFQAIAGTSMSSPHVAGAGILLAAVHPDWTPGQIKSALMTTATTDVVKEDETSPADPFDMGSGRIDVAAAATPGLTISDDADHFAAVAASPVTAIDANTASIDAPIMPGRVTTHRVVRNVGSGSGVYTVSTTAPAGTSIAVSPNRFTIAAGATRTLTITISADGAEGQQFGQIDLTAPGRSALHVPVAFVPTQGDVELASSCAPEDVEVGTPTTCDVTATNGSANDTTVDLTTTVDEHLTVTGAGPDDATHTATSASLDDVPLAGRDPGVPSIEEFGPLGDGYIPLDIPQIGAEPISIGDEEALDFDTDPFVYDGVTYSSLSVVSNGYVVVGGPATSEDIQCCPPQQIPDAAPPNNVLAPFWSDLTGEGADDPAPDGILAATVSFGPGADYTVLEFRLNPFGTDDLKVFQVWIGNNGEQDISFNYDPDFTNLDGVEGGLTIGAENEDGSGGEQLDETADDDTPPPADIAVVSTDPTPGDSVTLSVDANGASVGTATVHSEMTTPEVSGVTTIDSTVEVLRSATEFDAYVAQVFTDLLGRDPSATELDRWSTRLQTGARTRLQFTTALTQSDEWRGLVVDRLYGQVLDRAPTAGQRSTTVGALRDGQTEKALVGRLGGSAEFFDAAGSTNAGTIDLLFERLLGRPPTPDASDRLVARLDGGASRATIATEVYQRVGSRKVRVNSLFDRYLHHAPSTERQAHYVTFLATKSDSDVAARLTANQEYFDNSQ